MLLNLSTGHYFSLDATGTRMWEVLLSSQDREEAVRELEQWYEVDSTTLGRDLDQLIERLIEYRLLDWSDDAR